MKKWVELTTQEQDALVAEKVMGLQENKSVYYSAMRAPFYCISEDEVYIVERSGERYSESTFSPSTDMNDAWKVVEKINTLGRITLHVYKRFTSAQIVDFQKSLKYESEALTAPEAICKTALRAVGVDIE